MPKSDGRRRAFLVLCAAAVVGLAVVYWRSAAPAPTVHVAPPDSSTDVIEAPVVPEPEPPSARALEIAWKRIFFRWTQVDEHYGKLAFVERAAPKKPKFVDSLACEVTHVAAGRGICLQAERGVFTRYMATGFDRRFAPSFSIPLAGVPSRTRVSTDGKIGAMTVFLTGHSYASVDFTTQTLLVRLPSGEEVADLETFRLVKDGKAFRREDLNFWGVTFAPDGDRFYCTVSTNRQHYLVRGSLRSRTGEVIRENVECPSLSPDATRIAYKRRLPGSRATWQLHVLDLETGETQPLAERRNVDDQLEWLDNRRVLYTLPHDANVPGPTMDLWVASTDGASKPTLFLAGAYSPAVER